VLKFGEDRFKFLADENLSQLLVEEIVAGKYDKSFKNFQEKEGPDSFLLRYCDIEMFEIERLLDEKDCKHFYVTESVVEESEKLKVKEPFDLAWLQPIKDGKKQFNFGEWYIRYEKIGARIIGTAGHRTPRQDANYFEYTFFNMNLDDKSQSLQLFQDDTIDYYSIISSKDFDQLTRKLFFQLICFVELAPIEEIYLPARGSHGQKKSPNKFLNDTDFPMTVIGRNWNKIIHVGPIEVDAHYRLQPHGPGSKFRKLIYILPHSREGYNLSALKSRLN
jgi:hypothetical protein